MTRNFSGDVTCLSCGWLLYNLVPLPGSNQFGINEDIPAELKARKDGKYYFKCEKCDTKNEVQVIPMDNGTGSRIVPTGEKLPRKDPK